MDITNKFIKYLESKKVDCVKQAEFLKADDRADESNMEKIRANVYEIALSVTRTAEKISPDAPLKFIDEKLSSIPNAWKESLASAEVNNDYEKAAVEQIKLDTAAEILKVLKWGENND